MAKAVFIAALAIVALQDQRCRAGRHFTREVTKVPLADLEEAEIESLRNDPFLSVTECELEVVEAAGDPDAAAKEAEDKAKAEAAAKDADKAKEDPKK